MKTREEYAEMAETALMIGAEIESRSGEGALVYASRAVAFATLATCAPRALIPPPSNKPPTSLAEEPNDAA